jgi:ectoine hydroxylase-related dioxygenase (phytanoyl-CoA dioxygenase family)
MKDWFGAIASNGMPSASAARDLEDAGFIIVPGPVPDERLALLSECYDAAVKHADAGDVSVGSTTTRVSDFVNRGPEFDELYQHQPVLDAARLVINQPFKLSAMHARTVRPHSPAQDLHVDFARDASGWPMVGFILMLDEFRADNGATRFVPGSHKWSEPPANPGGRKADDEGQVLACGAAGSMIVYNGSVWHGHAANRSGGPRRSIQGAYIRRDVQSGANLPARMRPETLARIGPLAKYLLAL